MTVYEFMEDFDNAELDDYEWKEQLKEAVIEYNENYGTDFNPSKIVLKYIQIKNHVEN